MAARKLSQAPAAQDAPSGAILAPALQGVEPLSDQGEALLAEVLDELLEEL